MKRLSRLGRPRSIGRIGDRVMAVVVAACLWRTCVAHAETVLVLPASGQNVSAAVVREARAVFTERLAAHCLGCWVIDRDAYPSAVPLEPTAEIPLAASMGAQALVTLNIAHGDQGPPALTVVTATLYAFGPGRFPVGYPVRVTRTTTTGPELLGALLDEMVVVLVAGGRPTNETVPHDGGRGVRGGAPAEPRHWFFGADVGGTGLMNTPAEKMVWLPHLALFTMYLGATSLFDLRAENANLSGEQNMQGVGMGGYGRLGPHWFVGGSARWAWQHIEGRGANGVLVQPTLVFLHPLPVWPLLRVDFGYAVSLFQERGVDRLIVGSGAPHRAHGPRLAIGVAF